MVAAVEVLSLQGVSTNSDLATIRLVLHSRSIGVDRIYPTNQYTKSEPLVSKKWWWPTSMSVVVTIERQESHSDGNLGKPSWEIVRSWRDRSWGSTRAIDIERDASCHTHTMVTMVVVAWEVRMLEVHERSLRIINDCWTQCLLYNIVPSDTTLDYYYL